MDRVNHIKRPMNPFMVWSRLERQRIHKMRPDQLNSDISTELGARWRSLSKEEKLPYEAEAERLKEEHKQKYPGYKYKPAKKAKNNGTNGMKSAAQSDERNASSSFPIDRNQMHQQFNCNSNGMHYTMGTASRHVNAPFYGQQSAPQQNFAEGFQPGRMTENFPPMRMMELAHHQIPAHHGVFGATSYQYQFQPFPNTVEQMFPAPPARVPLSELSVSQQHCTSFTTIHKPSNTQCIPSSSTGHSTVDAIMRSTSSTTSSKTSSSLSGLLVDEFSDIFPTVKSLPFYDDYPWDDLYKSII